MIKPITPDEIEDAKLKTIPESIIGIINDLVAVSWDGNSSEIKQSDLIDAVCKKSKLSRSQVIGTGWLEFEAIYRKIGWKVVYDKPGYNEKYDPFWIFSKEKK